MDYLALQGRDARSYSQTKLKMNLLGIENSIKKKWELFVEYWLDADPDVVCKELNKNRVLMIRNKKEPIEGTYKIIIDVLLLLSLAFS